MICDLPLVQQLRVQRKRLGLGLGEVAAHCELCEARLEQWEAGGAAPELDDLCRWAAALGLGLTLAPIETAAQPAIEVDWQARHIQVKGSPVRLTRMEWKLLERLAVAPGKLVSHQDLFDYLYHDGRDDAAQANAVRVLIARLRRKLSLSIEARWGQGYIVSGIEASRPPAIPGTKPDAPPPPSSTQAFGSRQAAGMTSSATELHAA
jgi:transcriptional regulator with XRE-family HTH domain